MTRPQANATPDAGTMILFEAIARRRQINSVYNAMELRIAPHVLYTRDDKLYLGGVVTMRRGAPVSIPKLSIFKVAGLGDLSLLDETFRADPGFDPADARFAATTVFVVEP